MKELAFLTSREEGTEQWWSGNDVKTGGVEILVKNA